MYNFSFLLSLSEGDAKDSFQGNNQAPFSTIDKGNTTCTKKFGAWWFPKDSTNCGYSNLNGNYQVKGIRWDNWSTDPHAQGTKAEMKIKPNFPRK